MMVWFASAGAHGRGRRCKAGAPGADVGRAVTSVVCRSDGMVALRETVAFADRTLRNADPTCNLSFHTNNLLKPDLPRLLETLLCSSNARWGCCRSARDICRPHRPHSLKVEKI